MDQYGEFSGIISNLQSSLSEVRTVWTDQTAATYDCIDENIQRFVMQIWIYFSNTNIAYDTAKKYYNKNDFDENLDMLSAKAASV